MTKEKFIALINELMETQRMIRSSSVYSDTIWREGEVTKKRVLAELIVWAEPYFTDHEWKPISPPQHLREEIHDAIRKTQENKKGSYC